MKTDNASQSSSARRYGLLLVIWSVLLGGSLLWAMYQETRNTLGVADAAARANISKDIGFRRWATSHGGVYVPPTEHTPSNPYLKVPDRDVVTTAGINLTLMNPAYMLRELQTDFPGDYGTRSHITSLKLLNPQNAPDAWETSALRAFDQGEKERLEEQQIDGQPYLRMMRPLIAEPGCLKCHAFQGYKVGEVRGGISTAVALTPYLARERQLKISLALTHGAIWLIGLIGLGFSYRRDRHQAAEHEKTENELRESEQKYHLVADYTSDWEYWIGLKDEIVYMSPSCKALTGHDVAEFSADPGLLLAIVHPDDRAAYEAHWHVHSEHAEVGEAEFRIVSKDGETRWISHRCRPVFDSHGNWRGIRAGNRDITERKRAEVTRWQLAAIVESSNDAIIGKTPDGIITSSNKGAETIYGYAADEIIGKSITILASPSRHAEVHELLERVRKGGTVANHESERIRKDGALIQVALTLSPIRDASGNITGISTIARDITEKKRMEEELHRASVYNRSLIEASLDPLVTISAEGKITDVNRTTEAITGRSRSELIGTDFSDYFTEPDKAREGYRQVFAQGSVTDYPLVLRHRDGHVTDVLYNASVYRNEVGEVLGVFAAARDITERKRTEEALRENEHFLDSLIEHIPNMVFVKDATHLNFVRFNKAGEALLGYSRDELLGKNDYAFFSKEQADFFIAKDREIIDSRESLDIAEEPINTKFLGQRYLHTRKIPIFSDDGSPLYLLGISEDITEHKLAEEKLRHSEQGLSEAQRIAHLGNWNLDLVTNVLTWSDEIYRIFEIDPEKFDASYEAFLNTIHPDDRELVNKAYTDSLKDKRPYNIVHRLLMKDGRVKYVNEKCETHYADDGTPLLSIGTVHDVTERKRAEDEVKALNRDLEQRVTERTAQLEAANKELEAFSYSVSHDLRTPLRAIDGFSHILLDDYTDKLDEEGKRLLNVVRENTNKMGQLIDDILKFSRTGRLGLTISDIDMEQQAREVFAELQPSVDSGKLQLEIEAIPPARGDNAMMRQVFVNLLSNAIKFSRNRNPARIKVGGSIQGDEAIFYVKDNGVGFDMQYADKLFGVFQRLHGVTEFEGTGIGLAIVKRIITRHGGRVWAQGTVNEGATFYFALPIKEAVHG